MSLKEYDKPHVTNFIKNIIDQDLKDNKHSGWVITRFPPEPNGYLHIGHAKSICLNFGLALEYTKARCHLRFDDTNPAKEEQEYIESIKNDVKWLGFDWGDHLYHASDYFDQLFDFAIELIKTGKAYVCSLTAEQIKEYRGTLTTPGRISPYRERSVEENLDLFQRMKEGEFLDGEHVLRAKIDMSSGNINMRDPTIYRIKHMSHPVTGDKWCIYPMYDFTHCISDALEGITHSLCTLEFEDHRPLYDWFLDNLPVPCHPQQIEFARLELNYTVTSKRKLKELVDKKFVNGWDDPRMPTIAGLRRRGYSPQALRQFCERIGVSKKQTIIDYDILEECVRDDLNVCALRAMCVIEPLKVVITNYDEAKEEWLVVPNHPQDESKGVREMPFSKEIYIDSSDFMENPPNGFFRLALGKEVRLRYGYIIRCDEVIKDQAGKIIQLNCTYDRDTLGKKPEGRKVKGIIHWVSAKHSLVAEIRMYERLFTVPDPSKEDGEFTSFINPQSLKVIKNALVEPYLKKSQPEQQFQFERVGYFCSDRIDHSAEKLVFNKIVGLKEVWQKD